MVLRGLIIRILKIHSNDEISGQCLGFSIQDKVKQDFFLIKLLKKC